MILEQYISSLSNAIWSWPLIIIYILVGLYATASLGFVQLRYLFSSFKYIFKPEKTVSAGAVMSPFQAFINALGAATGNGSIAGMATAVALGGPGAAFWILVAGLIALVLRFAEVYLSTYVIGKYSYKGAHGGPMVYLSLLPGGSFLPYFFSFCMLFYSLSSGNAMQVNAIGAGLYSTWKVEPMITASIFVLFLVYIIAGGAKRILKISDTLVPFKVSVFLISAIIVLLYHYANIIPALKLIFENAFSVCSIGGALAGFTIQQTIKNGIARSLNANEAGLGSAGFLFGASGAVEPVKVSIMSMAGVFISTYFVCFLVALSIIASGVWDNGLTSTPLTISAYNTVFGVYGGWVVTFCAASFGLGVLVSFYFIAKECWLFLTSNKFPRLFDVIYCLVAFRGTLAKVDLIWSLNDIVNALMLLINLYAIIYFMPKIKKALADFEFKKAAK